ncbi:MAG: ABC transporter ATP-binding protein [Pseudomonadota bacterium]|nr:ABC transporter ATP-binding protein [Pseudomonadota bacterium]
MSILEIKDARVRYGQVEALLGVDLKLEKGAIATVIGPNGAGKSTLLNGVMGLLDFTGEIRLDGTPVQSMSVEERVERGLSLVPEQRALFGALPVEDNLVLGGFSRRKQGRRAITDTLEEVYVQFPRLKERRRQLASTLSGGERQMLAIGRGLMAKPTVLMLDEPSLGLAPKIVQDILAMVDRLRQTGLSVLLVEQNARAALEIANYAYVLENGAISVEGPAADMKDDARVVASYLGSEAA